MEPTKPRFHLSKSNIVFLGFVFVIWLIGFLLERPTDPFRQGEKFGSLFTFCLFPSVIAWIVWLFSGKSNSASSVIFNVVLGLCCLGALNSLAEKGRQNRAFNELKDSQSAFSEAIAGSDGDAQQINKATEEFNTTVNASFEKLATNATGKEAEFYKILQDFAHTTQAKESRWSESMDAVMDESILNFSTLNDQAEAVRQLGVIQTYISESEAYKAYFLGMPELVETKLKPLGENFGMAVGGVKGTREKVAKFGPIIGPLLDCHVEYGKEMAAIIEFLQKNEGKWTFEEYPELEDENAQKELDAMIENLTTHEEKINQLSAELIELH